MELLVATVLLASAYIGIKTDDTQICNNCDDVRIHISGVGGSETVIWVDGSPTRVHCVLHNDSDMPATVLLPNVDSGVPSFLRAKLTRLSDDAVTANHALTANDVIRADFWTVRMLESDFYEYNPNDQVVLSPGASYEFEIHLDRMLSGSPQIRSGLVDGRFSLQIDSPVGKSNFVEVVVGNVVPGRPSGDSHDVRPRWHP